MAYKWKQNLACVATYKVLEDDNFLDQFEECTISFEKAPEVKMNELRYYLQTTHNPALKENLSIGIARKFIKNIKQLYTVSKENQTVTNAEEITKIAQIFMDGNKKIVDLAEAIDRLLKFQDE